MTVGSVVKAVAILRHLADSAPLGVNAIARAVGISPSSCFGILRTLAAEGFLDFDPTAKTYRIGTLPGRLFNRDDANSLDGWRTWLGERIKDLATAHFACAGIWQRRDDRVELMVVAESPAETRLHLTVGQRLPTHIGAMGRCIAAREQLTDSDLLAILTGLRWQEPPSADDYLREVRAAGDSGWALDEGHYLRGVTTVASTIAGRDGQVRFCLTVSTFSGQFDAPAIHDVGTALADLAQEAERRLIAMTADFAAPPSDAVVAE